MVRLLAVLVLAAASASSVLAGTSYYQNTAPINLVSEYSRITGSYGNNYDAGTRINAANNSVSLRVGFDTSISKMWVDQITFNIAIAPKILTSNLVDVYGALKEITTTKTNKKRNVLKPTPPLAGESGVSRQNTSLLCT